MPSKVTESSSAGRCHPIQPPLPRSTGTSDDAPQESPSAPSTIISPLFCPVPPRAFLRFSGFSFASASHEGPRTRRRERDRRLRIPVELVFLAQLHTRHLFFARKRPSNCSIARPVSQSYSKDQSWKWEPKYEKERTQYQPCRKVQRSQSLFLRSFLTFDLMSDSESRFVT